ncbi:unnamed protein product [Trifolium pratense]|uniref:Uncharacterized protein n=1 Tax=Trifolium pratense TaxID=57577 RepID=A0ACB0LCQ8_TRIPR|nr:unnamed protein product [Trifolium pratense]
MHLWPTKSLRDSFKISYLKNLQWNYQRMENDQQRSQSSSTQHKLLEDKDNNNNSNVDTPKPHQTGGVLTSICHDLLLLLSCCYCCFCCGGTCVEEK